MMDDYFDYYMIRWVTPPAAATAPFLTYNDEDDDDDDDDAYDADDLNRWVTPQVVATALFLDQQWQWPLSLPCLPCLEQSSR